MKRYPSTNLWRVFIVRTHRDNRRMSRPISCAMVAFSIVVDHHLRPSNDFSRRRFEEHVGRILGAQKLMIDIREYREQALEIRWYRLKEEPIPVVRWDRFVGALARLQGHRVEWCRDCESSYAIVLTWETTPDNGPIFVTFRCTYCDSTFTDPV